LTPQGTNGIPVTTNLTGLNSNTTYYFRIVATNSAGTIKGGQKSFTTSSAAPTVFTTGTTFVTSTSATLNGTVNPNGEATTYYFEYGLDTSYGSPTSSASAGSGTSAVSVNASISGLSSDTTYHYRLVATNSDGTSYGDDKTFNTIILYVTFSGSCGGKTPCYSTIQAATDVARSGAIIKIVEGTYSEDLGLNSTKELIFSGGWDSTFSTQAGNSTITFFTIDDGTAIIENIVIQ